MKIYIAKSMQDIKDCYPVMAQLRTGLKKEEFIERVNRQQKDGYILAFIRNKGIVVTVAGFRIIENLAHGKFLYIDDFITDSQSRSKGYGDKLFDFLVEYAKKEMCKEIHLDSGVQRFDAHRFYFRKRMVIISHHFGLRIAK
ncbi:MAG: GNAT family N-acetyltransferase [Candidatus Levybacteria bacterium]|nr:GNAT family N-acetyltransferase [Candidatus Levybacteria bacterium]